ncbi:MAG: Uma2 family endonuclease [Xenococcus sp. MO_188.B8]|nr:Uma2 family endonuclease [Xenococcus sp. MO_188.B8]
MMPITLNLRPTIELTDEQFALICSTNRDLRLERTATGELVIMPPTGGATGKINSSINAQLWLWNQQYELGEVFDSSTGFKLPNGATRSPDAAWVKKERWERLTLKQQQNFIPLCPDFVIELRWDSDSLLNLQKKMQEYLANGLVLGWLIDLPNNQVEVYQQDYQLEVISNPVSLFGDDILSGFTLEIKNILK